MVGPADWASRSPPDQMSPAREGEAENDSLESRLDIRRARSRGVNRSDKDDGRRSSPCSSSSSVSKTFS